MKLFAGIDVGSSRTKAVIIDENQDVVGFSTQKSGTDFTQSARDCLLSALNMQNLIESDIAYLISTGYGRKNVDKHNDTKTEISCHGRGCFYYYPEAITVIDIGGQDNKIIKMNDKGKRFNFKMNRKCAAGTGAFLEEMSTRLDLSLDEMNTLAAQTKKMVKLGSYCTVFSGTEVLENIRHGKNISEIVRGIFYSIITRVMEMDSFTDKVVLTGGIAEHSETFVAMAKDIIPQDVVIPKNPQCTGALGAALYAFDNCTGK